MPPIQITNFDKVGDFMEAFGQEVLIAPKTPDPSVAKLRLELIREEVAELQAAVDGMDMLAIADGLTDILYVVYGAGHAFGIDLDECFHEVHSSNMTKLGPGGRPLYREDGKVMKGPNYREPNLEPFVC
tara:strand:+ start:870 stop:1256 length:387 start_codon:yes stop_codon:yes gene_type:complete